MAVDFPAIPKAPGNTILSTPIPTATERIQNRLYSDPEALGNPQFMMEALIDIDNGDTTFARLWPFLIFEKVAADSVS
jgi:hypothetical protein